MSASRERRQRQADPQRAMTQKERAELKEQKAAKQKTVLYAAIGVIVAILVVILLVWDSGIFQRAQTAMSIAGRDYKVTDVEYYYRSALNQEYTLSMYGMSSFDNSVDPAEQYRDEAQTQTYRDYFLEQATTALKAAAALENSAAEEGFTLSDEGKASVDEQIENTAATATQYGYNNLEGYLRAYYGKYMTKSAYRICVERTVLLQEYQQHYKDNLSITDEDLNTYYTENKDSLDTYEYYYALIDGTAQSTTDADGNTMEPTEEEKEAAMAEAKEKADTFADALNEADDKGAAFLAQVTQYVGTDAQSDYSTLNVTKGSNLSSTYSSWLQDSARQSGDVTVIEDTSGYYVLVFQNCYLDETPSVDIRHILIQAELDQQDDPATTDVDESTVPSQASLDAAKAEAESLLAQWESGDKTAESFGELANANSDDPGSNTNGGLYEQVVPGEMFDAFNDWIFDASRQSGDTGLVENTQSGQQGWHVIYFQGQDQLAWKVNVTSTLKDDRTNEWIDGMVTDLEVTQGDGLSYVG